MSLENTHSNVANTPSPAIGLNSITILVLPIFLVFAFAVALCARELAAHVVYGDGDGAMLTRISATSPKADAGYDFPVTSRAKSSGAEFNSESASEQ